MSRGFSYRQAPRCVPTPNGSCCAAGPLASGCRRSRRRGSGFPVRDSWSSRPTASRTASTRDWMPKARRSPWPIRSWRVTAGEPTMRLSWWRASPGEAMQDAKDRLLRDQYAAALRQYLADAGGEAALQRAYELGRRAIGDGVGVLELIALHQDVLDGILRERKEPEACVNAVSDAGRFVAESLSPF